MVEGRSGPGGLTDAQLDILKKALREAKVGDLLLEQFIHTMLPRNCSETCEAGMLGLLQFRKR